MDEYLKREVIIKEINTAPAYFDSGDIRYGLLVAMDIVKKLPASDATEIKHGKWEFIGDYASCSYCGRIFEALPTEYAFTLNNAYCRHCGTKMDREEDK